MIQIIDDYYIDVDNAKGCINYIVRRGPHKVDHKGTNKDTLIAYCGTMAQAIKCVREKIIANALKDGSHTLGEALAVVKNETDRLMKELESKGLK